MPADDERLIPIEKPTGLHRYVMRDAPNLRTLRIHQMEWSVIDFTTGSNGTERIEWRDVPLVQETKTEAIMATVYEHRRQGLPDYEKPPLGQPPAFLQEQEPKEAYAGEERLARVGASLAKQLQTSIERNAELNALVQKYGRALEWIVENGAASHPANVIKVAEEGLA